MTGVGRLMFILWLGAAFGQVLALLALFNTLEDARSDAIGRTLQIMVARVDQAASASSTIGLPLAYQSGLGTLIDELTQSAPDAADLYIVDVDGNIVFSSDAAAIGSKAATRWLQPTERSADGSWLDANSQETVAGANVLTGINTSAGSVVAVASRANLAIDVLADMRTAVVAALGFLVLAGALAVAGTALATRQLGARLNSVAARYRHAALDVRGGHAPDDDARTTPCIDAVGLVMATIQAVDERGLDADHVSVPETVRTDAKDPATQGDAR